MLKQRSIKFPVVALTNIDQIDASTQRQVKMDSTLQWLQEAKNLIDVGNVNDTSAAPLDSNASEVTAKAKEHEQIVMSCSNVPQETKGVSIKHVKKLYRRIDRLERDYEAGTCENRALRQQLQTLEQTEKEARCTVSQLSQQLAKSERMHQSAQQKLKVVSGKEVELRRISGELRARIRDLERDKADLGEQVISLMVQVESLNEKLKQVSESGCVDEDSKVSASASADYAVINGIAVENSDLSDLVPECHIIDEKLGFLDEENGVCLFRPAHEAEASEPLDSEVAAGFEIGDTVKRVLWSDGRVELVPLQYRTRSRTISVRSFPRIRRSRRTASEVRRPASNSQATSTPFTGDIVIVGGDCPTRYTEALCHLAPNVSWHNGFTKKEKLEQLLRRASLVVTIETQLSHWAMWRIKELAKVNQFVWRHVKVKSLSSVKAAVMEATEAVGSGV